MDNLLQQMGRRVYVCRKQLHLTQEALAEKAGVTPQMISSAELGQKALRPENIIKICRALDISPNYLLLGENLTDDTPLLSQKISQLTPWQYQNLEDIINSYIAGVTGEEA